VLTPTSLTALLELDAGAAFATFDPNLKIATIAPQAAHSGTQQEVRVRARIAECPLKSTTSSFMVDFLPACSITTYGPSATPEEFLPATAVLEIT